VRLLTIHGAKGLEAPLVLDAGHRRRIAIKAETMGVLVDWPGESDEAPSALPFWPAKVRPPACVAVDALAAEQAGPPARRAQRPVCGA
jgi:ATP-dependent helicase/nuclease subunit A